ncbi:glycoside hydrolase family 31 protein [Aaosphaeria arxii CBS 175.79]|uniref:alpha-glucosidase n=1 Tax=Aaosphaeria arxii CBS 175.79 TaxID=1450172 RepID=A0A6A5XQQ3_9PLEO|nr:glycoside hydrolase family 31 protein [Aaosphaeria arxii CBS 175.79]KAF2015167.1 glycoside hydrolase family 31 protein [Aaosphaeria arxii CBS 175.79]
MPQEELVPLNFQLAQRNNSSNGDIILQTKQNGLSFEFTFQALRPGLFRTTFTSSKHPLPPHRAAPVPSGKLEQGEFQSSSPSPTCKSFDLNGTIASVDWAEGPPIVSLTLPGHKTPIHADLPNRSYVADHHGVSHYTRYNKGTLHVGLGEKAAPLNLSNRHFVLSATDSFGYDVHRTDPLYKHIPLLINATPEGVVATFSTSHARGFYSIGSEMDGLWGRFKVYRQEFGGLEEYLITGRTIQDVVRTYADIVGYPLLVPRWAFGYLAGGMKYSMLDEPRACDALMGFAQKLKEHDIPCSGFQMSSGYTVAETEPKTRNVFTWNRHRFPDPKGFMDAYHKEGIRLIANVKPYVLGNHPEYEKLKKLGAFFTNPATGGTGEARLWSAGGGESGVGGHIDFTSEAGYKWWYEGVRELKKVGIDCIWNDNNEYTLPNDSWQCALNEKNVNKGDGEVFTNAVGFWGRALNTELMGKSSYDAALDVVPNERPFILTRSATAGTLRYCASSWSGDNVTSWDGMRGANALSLNAGLCLMQCYGHDIGGFEGEQPSPELLVRWCQQGIYSSRFAINCFKTSPENNSVGDVIEPWMYEETTPLVRDIIKRRYELIPYLYSLALLSHQTATPPQRWTGSGYESDPEVWTNRVLTDGETQYWLGDSLLVGGVFEPGQSTAKVYLPRDASNPDLQFLDLNDTQKYYSAGQWIEVSAKWTDSIPVLAKVGGAVPVGLNVQVLSVGETANPANLPTDDYRAVEIFPPPNSNSIGREYINVWYEDDGISPPPASISVFTVRYSATEKEVRVSLEEQLQPGFEPAWKDLGVILPAGDDRTVIFAEHEAKLLKTDDKGRKHFTASIGRAPRGTVQERSRI